MDLAHPPGGQIMPWDWLGPSASHQQACSSLRPSFTHQWADTSHKKTIAPQPTDTAHPLAGQILPWRPAGPWPQPSAVQQKVQDTLGPAANCVRKQPHPPMIKHKFWDPWDLQPDSRTWLHPQWLGNSPEISWTLTPPTSNATLVPPPRVSAVSHRLTQLTTHS